MTKNVISPSMVVLRETQLQDLRVGDLFLCESQLFQVYQEMYTSVILVHIWSGVEVTIKEKDFCMPVKQVLIDAG
jgi:hypothetical protein